MRWVAGILTAVLLAGCASTQTASGGPAGSTGTSAARPVTVKATCPPDLTMSGRPSNEPGGPVPATATIAWVLRCRTEVQPVAGKGSWEMLLTERADGNPSALRAALNRPSERRTDGACPAIAMVVPYFVLVDSAGIGYLPTMPYDACQLPQPAALEELNRLPFRLVSSTPIRQVESALAQQSGCSQGWKDLINVEAGSASPAGPANPWPSPPTLVRVCVYTAAQGGDGGNLRFGRLLSETQTTQLLQAILGSPRAGACSRTHTQFALVLPAKPDGEPWYVEIDGCQRVLRPNHTLGQATSETLALLNRLARGTL
jgi:hypothetical protein